ncbi:MAG: type I methionyl aminopeptidase [Hyphomonadaceae bacterium]
MNYAEAEAYERQGQIKIHDPKVAFPGMAAAGKLAAECLDMLVPEVKEGVTTARIDDLARQFVFDHGALPACVNYRGYRHTVCTSVNHVVCHGIPGDRVLRDGDIVNIDVTVIVDGWHGDTSRMYAIGPNVSRKAQRLMDMTYEAMMRGLAIIKPGVTLGDLGHAIQSFAEGERTSIVREFCGHGLGRVFHDAPNVLHFGKPGQGDVLKAGMIFTVEPMLNAGSPAVKVLNDGWTAVTKDKSLSAQYEHSVGVTEDGVVIFTKSPAGLDEPHKLNATA